MYRKSFYLLAFVLLLLPLGGAMAQVEPPTSYHTAAVWDVSYWNNTTLSGSPVFTGQENNLDWNWGLGSPNTAVSADDFSARWMKYIDVTAGAYRFTATADDGVRVYVDDHLIINDWSEHPARTTTADLFLSAGHHLIKVEYYERGGYAVAKLDWAPVTPAGSGWRGEYFSNRWFNGAPALVRTDTAVDFNWGAGAPAPGLPADNFAVRWTRTVNFSPGSYRFTTTSDDGVRLWVNGHLLIDKWFDQAASSYSGVLYLSGDVPIKLEYYENGGLASARLVWSKDDAPPPAGAVIVDNGDPGFRTGGTATSWRSASAGYNSSMLWTYNNDVARSGYNWARWYPSLTAGRYELFAYIPAQNATTRQARYWIAHRDGYTLKVIDQNSYSNQWVSLGTYRFQGSGLDYVSLADVTGEAYLSRMLGFDAMKWESR